MAYLVEEEGENLKVAYLVEEGGNLKVAYLLEEGENLEEEGLAVLSCVSLEGEVMEKRGLEEVGSSSVAPALQ